MADKLYAFAAIGTVLYARRVRAVDGQCWHVGGVAYETYDVGHWSDYVIAATEVQPGLFEITVPAGGAAGAELMLLYTALGGIGNEADSDSPATPISYVWDGTGVQGLYDIYSLAFTAYTATLSLASSLLAYYSTCLTSGASTLVLQVSASSVDGTYVGGVAVNRTTGEAIPIVGYVGATRTCTLSRPWSTVPANGDPVSIITPVAAGVTLASSERVYHARIEQTRDNPDGADKYTVLFMRDLVWLLTGITSPTIRIVKCADGTELLAETPLTQIGATGAYKFEATGANRLTAGEAAIVEVRATIDGQNRKMERIIELDA